MSKQHFDETYGLKDAPKHYELYFVPVIGEPVAKDLVRHAKLQPGEKVLDAACGTGIVARLALKRVGDTGSVTGLDINPGMLAVAGSINKQIEWHEAPAEAIPFPDETFDVVLCQMGLQFMEDKPAALKEMHRVLAPGGRLVLNVPGPAGPPFADFADATEQTMGPEAAGFVKHVFSLHDTDELQRLMDSAGFREVDTRAKEKMLSLPAPEEFLWQYVHSTPLVGLMAETGDELRAALEQKVVKKWQSYVKDGSFIYPQRIVTVSGRK